MYDIKLGYLVNEILFELLHDFQFGSIDTSQCALCIIELTINCTHFIFQWGRTPLIAACEGGHSATAQLLIENRADLNKQNKV